MPTRRSFLAAVFNSVALSHILSARCSFGIPEQAGQFQVSQAVIYVPNDPAQGSQPYDSHVTLTMGAGNNVQRFDGLFRKYDYSLYPRSLGLVCYGHLIRADKYENNDEGAGSPGGLDLVDLVGTGTGTDEGAVQAVLGLVPNLSFSGANIGGTGVVFNGEAGKLTASAFLWRNGHNPTLKADVDSAGETALEYIGRWDAVSAVYTGSGAAAGFYRLYEQIGGTIRRALIGGRPRGTADFTFTEGADIWQATSSREYPTANRVYVQGFDDGKSLGPVSNYFSSTLQSSNPFMPSIEKHTATFSSPMLERGLDSDAGTGMSCETVANAIMLNVNRETVRCEFVTPRDDLIGPGHTILVKANVAATGTNAGGTVDRLGIGEPLWVLGVDVSVGEDGAFSQRITCLGGGSADTFTPAPPV